MSDAPAPTRAEEGRETGQDDLAARFALEERTALIGDLTDLQACLSVDGRAYGAEIVARAIVALTAAEAEVARLTQERDEALCLAEGPSTLLDLARGSISRGMELHTAEAEVARLTAALAEAERERDAAITVQEMCAMSGGFYARHSENATNRAEAAEASASVLRERVATLEAVTDRLHKDNERLRWRHPAVLPDWNDLPDGLRAKLAKTADGYDPDWGGDLAVNMYAALRQAMMEATHADN